jgi:N-acetylmuramoyl-L-alanine amidase
MKNRLATVLLPLSLLLQSSPGRAAPAEPAASGAQARPVKIILDAGHIVSDASKTGVNSNDRAGKVVREADFNDEVVKLLAAELRSRLPRATVVLTRPYGEDGIKGTKERSLLADTEHADLFLAIHHDAAQEVFVDHAPNAIAGQEAWILKPSFAAVDRAAYDKIRAKGYTDPPPWSKGDLRIEDYIGGFSLYVSAKIGNAVRPESKKLEQSKRLATLLADEILALGRKPALYHAEKITGEGVTLLDPARGLYLFNELAVLRWMKAEIPAVLLEVGVLVNPADQAAVADPAFRQRLVAGIADAIEAYFTGT